MVLEALAGPGLAKALEARGDDRTAELVGQLTEAEARLEQLAADYYGSGHLSRAEYTAAKKRADETIDTIRGQLAASSSVLAGIDGDVAAWWDHDDTTTDQRRALLLAVLEHVEVGPALMGRNRFDPDRLTIRWRA